jgi:hypothetical protein
MRRRIEALADQFEEFVSEDGHDALVIDCGDEAGGFVAAAVDLTEQRGSLDVSFVLLDRFAESASLVSTLCAQVSAFAEAARLGALPTSPVSLAGLVDRLVELQRRASARGDVRCVVWVCPTSVDAPRAYVETALELTRLARDTARRVRVAVRDVDGAVLAAFRAAAFPVLHVSADFSARAMRDALAEQAADPSASMDERMAAAMTVAMTDAGRGATQGALEKLAQAEAHFAARGHHGHRAMAALSAAQVLALVGDLGAARVRAREAVALAVQAQCTSVVITGAMCAGELAMRDEDPGAAEDYFRLALGMACGARAVAAAIEISARLGDSLTALQRPREAHEVWGQALALARNAGTSSLARGPVERLHALYESAGMSREASVMHEVLHALGPAPQCHAHVDAP